MEENRNNTVVATPSGTKPPVAPQGQYVPASPYPPNMPYQNIQRPPVQQFIPQPPKEDKKTHGLGFNITSMAIGIITFLIGVSSLSSCIEYIYDNDSFYNFGSELSSCVTCLIFGLLCVSFAVIGIRKKENSGRSMGAAGLICGCLGVLSSILSIIILLSNF